MTFSFSEAQDAEYALGWPHVRRLVRRAKPKAGRALADAQKILRSVDVPWLPEATEARCLAYVRGWDVTPRVAPAEAIGLMASDAPLEEGVLDALFVHWRSKPRYWFQVEELVLALEALVGSDATGAALAAHYARQGLGDARDLDILFGNALTDVAQAGLFCLGFVALRSASTRCALRSLRDDARGPARATLDLVLDGAEGCRRHGVKHLFGGIFAGDDPEYLAGFTASERYHSSLTPRFCYLGGEPLIAHYVERAKKGVPPHLASRFVAWFGTIKHPFTVELMGILASKARTEKAALAWLREHASYAAEHARTLPDAVRAKLEG